MSSLHQAYNLMQQGQGPEASHLLHNLIKKEPDNSQAHYLLGLLALENNETDRATHCFLATIKISPEATPAHYNLGVLYQDRGELETARHHYQIGLNLSPQDVDIRFNLALTCKQLGLLTEAQQHFETVLETSPRDIDTLYNLANTEQALHQNSQAIKRLEALLLVEPDHLSALNNLGYLYHKEGLGQQAIPIYQKLIAKNHNSTAARHLLAALTGDTTSHAPTAYVKDVFDQFADHFDASLQENLGYNTPTLLAQLLKQTLPQQTFTHGLDLGCGTGLSGASFANCTTTLTGIDLSPKMLEQADKKGFYQSLHEADLVPFIQKSDIIFDLYLAADVFVYIGDLCPIFKAIAQKKTPSIFIFSTEQADINYSLKPSGRYGHAVSYIYDLAKEQGFTILAHESAPLRKEGAKWLDGELYILGYDGLVSRGLSTG